MKKMLCALLALIMVVTTVSVCFAEGKILAFSDVTEISGVDKNSGGFLTSFNRGSYFGFDAVDLTGINSVSVKADVEIAGNSNGDTFSVMVDNPLSGASIGYVTLTRIEKGGEYKCAIKPTSGTHKLYFRSLYGKGDSITFKVYSVTLLTDTYVNTASAEKVADSSVIDNYYDTWTATDDMGRAVADYEEVGDVKTDGRTVGMLYWNWFVANKDTRTAVVTSDILKDHPEIKDVYTSPIWPTDGTYYWAEPLLGFYDSYEYWTYRKHTEMLANAGVDVIFFDYSNTGYDYIPTLNILAQAFRDSKKAGVKVPKISAMTSLGGTSDNCFRNATAIYFNCFKENDYSDIWFYLDGKPLLFGNAIYKYYSGAVENGNVSEAALTEEMRDFFTYRYEGLRNNYNTNGIVGDNNWVWLENFPQVLRNPDKEGRAEFVVVGTGINQSYVLGGGVTGVFSDQYNKGRGYSEAFGEDYSENGKRMGYFFREQAALALDVGPKFLMVDGWNEWTAIRNTEYGGFTNAFVDNFDDENSRDFEPSAGALRDDYYNLLCDMVRKYKGVRPAPVASGAKTIDINGDIAQWEGVGPQFVNSNQDYERDTVSMLKMGSKTEHWTYKTTVNNAISGAKVSFDADNLYFMATATKDIKEDSKGFMNLYINTDRNHATGWEGYDYAVNLNGKGVLSKSATSEWAWENIGNVSYKITGNMITLAIPRASLGVTGTVDLEFKWTDSIETNGEILNFYKDGSSAPYGRFNYLYTEKQQTAIGQNDRESLSGTSILKAGNNRMIVSGGKMHVYEQDTRITPVEQNGTLYIPEYAYNEVMEYGHSKTKYNYFYNMFKTYHYDLNEKMTDIENNTMAYSLIDSNEVHVNGALKTLSNPVKVIDGMIYIPVSYIAECYGWTVESLGNGVYAVGKYGVDKTLVNSVLSHLN